MFKTKTEKTAPTRNELVTAQIRAGKRKRLAYHDALLNDVCWYQADQIRVGLGGIHCFEISAGPLGDPVAAFVCDDADGHGHIGAGEVATIAEGAAISADLAKTAEAALAMTAEYGLLLGAGPAGRSRIDAARRAIDALRPVLDWSRTWGPREARQVAAGELHGSLRRCAIETAAALDEEARLAVEAAAAEEARREAEWQATVERMTATLRECAEENRKFFAKLEAEQKAEEERLREGV